MLKQAFWYKRYIFIGFATQIHNESTPLFVIPTLSFPKAQIIKLYYHLICIRVYVSVCKQGKLFINQLVWFIYWHHSIYMQSYNFILFLKKKKISWCWFSLTFLIWWAERYIEGQCSSSIKYWFLISHSLSAFLFNLWG